MTWDEDDMNERPLNTDQILEMWRASAGHVIRFARMLESFHGIMGEPEEEDEDAGR